MWTMKTGIKLLVTIKINKMLIKICTLLVYQLCKQPEFHQLYNHVDTVAQLTTLNCNKLYTNMRMPFHLYIHSYCSTKI